MGKITNKADLNYRDLKKEYPFYSNAAILLAGGAGSGKSYFTYKILIPIYIKYAGIKTVLISSRTGVFDYTTRTELDNPIYKDVKVEFIKIDQSYKKCQEIRAEAIINEFLEKLMKVDTDEKLAKIIADFDKLLANVSDFEFLNEKLQEFRKTLESFLYCTMEEINDYSQMLFVRGTKLSYNPTIIVFDDYAGSNEFMKPYSDIHKLIYCRRHLHLTMMMLIQSITAISTSIRRNISIFVYFSTFSDRDLQLLKNRLPIK